MAFLWCLLVGIGGFIAGSAFGPMLIAKIKLLWGEK